MTVPGGLLLEEFKSLSLDAGNWLWGAAQGAFNEKATVSQIVVDAVIGMIPLVGDVTAVRDLIAVVLGLCNEPKKREEKFQWILLVVLIFALIPVIGGVVKGVGRLLLKLMEESAKLVGVARAARLAESAKLIVEFLNRLGIGNAEVWLAKLNFAAYEKQIVETLVAMLDRLDRVLTKWKTKLGSVVPHAVGERIEVLLKGLATVKSEAVKRIPSAIKELDETLREVQAYIRSGGETTSQVASHTATAGAKNLSYTDELILREGMGATRTVRGGLAQNAATLDDMATKHYYTPEPAKGFPDLTERPEIVAGKEFYRIISTYSGQVVNRELQPGERIFRMFGPSGRTLGQEIDVTLAAGRRPGSKSYWGLNEIPKSAESWRNDSAVLDEWNRDGFIIIGEIVRPVKGCTGTIAEQFGKMLPLQYLPGGAKQAVLEFPKELATKLNELGELVTKTGSAEMRELGGIRWEVRPTGWNDANAVHGYISMPGPGAVQTVRLGARELQTKQQER